jgi:hypothetical protein
MTHLDLTKPTAPRLTRRTLSNQSRTALTSLDFPRSTGPALPCLDWTHRTQPGLKQIPLGIELSAITAASTNSKHQRTINAGQRSGTMPA